MHRNQEDYENPDEYDPERFLKHPYGLKRNEVAEGRRLRVSPIRLWKWTSPVSRGAVCFYDDSFGCVKSCVGFRRFAAGRRHRH